MPLPGCVSLSELYSVSYQRMGQRAPTSQVSLRSDDWWMRSLCNGPWRAVAAYSLCSAAVIPSTSWLLSNLRNWCYFSSSGLFLTHTYVHLLNSGIRKETFFLNYHCIFYPWVIPFELRVKLNTSMSRYPKVGFERIRPSGRFQNFIVFSVPLPCWHSRPPAPSVPRTLCSSFSFPLCLYHLSSLFSGSFFLSAP